MGAMTVRLKASQRARAGFYGLADVLGAMLLAPRTQDGLQIEKANIDPAAATPCAWLPDDQATTPLAACASSSWLSRLYAPRILNEPVRCRHSGFRYTRPPAISSSRGDQISGVLTAIESRRSAAATISVISIIKMDCCRSQISAASRSTLAAQIKSLSDRPSMA